MAQSFDIPRVLRQPMTEPTSQATTGEERVRAGTSDETLMLELQRGSANAFNELFARYRDSIYGFFRRRLNDPARAEELSQETFVAVLKGASRYEPRATFRTYVYGIAMKQLFAERRKSAHREVSVRDPRDGQILPGDPDAALWVRRGISQLDPDHREILLLREYEELSYEEIGGLLHLPVNTVRSRLFRARMSLRDLLLPACKDSRNNHER